MHHRIYQFMLLLPFLFTNNLACSCYKKHQLGKRHEQDATFQLPNKDKSLLLHALIAAENWVQRTSYLFFVTHLVAPMFPSRKKHSRWKLYLFEPLFWLAWFEMHFIFLQKIFARFRLASDKNKAMQFYGAALLLTWKDNRCALRKCTDSAYFRIKQHCCYELRYRIKIVCFCQLCSTTVINGLY